MTRFSLLLVLLTACSASPGGNPPPPSEGRGPSSSSETEPPPVVEDTESLPPQPPEIPPAPPPPRPPLAWEAGHPDRAEWSERLLSLMKENLASFDTASDLTLYCPKYASLDADGKALALATLAVRVAFHESAFNPHSVFHEPPPLGVDSIGLFQLSYEDKMTWCTMDRGNRTLEDPLVNIACAVPKMARLVKKDGVIAQGHSGSTSKGLARYWSVMRDDQGATLHQRGDIRAAVQALPICH